MRQQYSQEQLQCIVDHYGIGAIERYSLFTSGFENSNYLIKTLQGSYVLKIFEGSGMTPENIAFEVRVMDACVQAGIRVPRMGFVAQFPLNPHHHTRKHPAWGVF